MTPEFFQITQIFIGSGILVVSLRVSFQIGTYTNRLEVLERELAKYSDKTDSIDKNVTVLIARSDVFIGLKKSRSK
jgi:hypothetical protein